MDSPIAFCLVAFTLLAMPGPTNTLLALSGASVGLRGSWVPLLGVLAAYLLSIVAQRVVVGSLFEDSTTTETLLRVVVAIYLVYLSVRLWRATSQEQTSVGTRSVFMATLLNPKALILALVLMPPEPLVPPFHFAALTLFIICTGVAWTKAGVLAQSLASDRYALAFPKMAAVALAAFAAVIVSSVFR
jgi:threonine/homoserine/homoserine lactone efflux protein